MTKKLSTQEIMELLREMKKYPATFNEAINVDCGFDTSDNKWDAEQLADYFLNAIEALSASGTCFLDILEARQLCKDDIQSFIDSNARFGLGITNKVLKRE
jgi:hypothetical protein